MRHGHLKSVRTCTGAQRACKDRSRSSLSGGDGASGPVDVYKVLEQYVEVCRHASRALTIIDGTEVDVVRWPNEAESAKEFEGHSGQGIQSDIPCHWKTVSVSHKGGKFSLRLPISSFVGGHGPCHSRPTRQPWARRHLSGRRCSGSACSFAGSYMQICTDFLRCLPGELVRATRGHLDGILSALGGTPWALLAVPAHLGVGPWGPLGGLCWVPA